MPTCHAGELAAPVSKVAQLPYCAPEATATAARSAPRPHGGPQQPPAVAVDAAADMWSIGVIALELLTQQRVFPEGSDETAVRHALAAGQTPGSTGGLPWEEGVVGASEVRLRIPKPLRHAVLACVDRDAVNRLSAASLLALWEAAPWERVIDEMRADVTT